IVEGIMSGQHRSPRHGFSVEFAQHRPYVAGDDIRHLDWKVFARSDKLHLKQYQQETNLDLVVLADSSGSMGFGTRIFAEASGIGRATNPRGKPNWTKFDHTTALAAALAYVTLQQGDRVGLGIFADDMRTMVQRSSAQIQWRRLVGALSTSTVDAPTDLTRAVDVALAKVHNKCLIAIISDFFTDLDAIRASVARIRHRGHDLMLFQVLDQSELTFDFAEAAPFVGLEGEEAIRIDPRSIREAYLESIGRHIDEVERIARRFGFDYRRLSTHDWLGPSLAAFIARRNAAMKRQKYG
ncbi:MAG: DUF58 domain-containing protein, partial [Phycisphaerales bacterium]|nr:DUF58 domain-containing protein [Phycisphaerales bacterium]